MGPFRNSFGEGRFIQKYARFPGQTWEQKAREVVDDVCRGILSEDDCFSLFEAIRDMKLIPGGRYLYYAGRPIKAFNNCYLLRAEEDTREEWSNIKHRASSCLMTGGGIGIDYSILRASGSILSRTGGLASGPVPLMHSINEIGRNIMQGGSRRSAIYASLNWKHGDIGAFLKEKNWHDKRIAGAFTVSGAPFTMRDAKAMDYDYHAPLDMTNISVNYDNAWLNKEGRETDEVFLRNVEQALSTGEPGFSFNFGSKENETLRNACTEVTSEDDSDVCNLGSVNMSRITSLEEFRDVVALGSKFLVCGTLRASLPYEKVYKVREKNRRLGLGLMGIHEWLLTRGMKYEVTPELHEWLSSYKTYSESSANQLCDSLSISRPVAYRAIAPTGSIGILAGTTTGIEPLFAVAYKRRYLDGNKWKYQYVVDKLAETIINEHNDVHNNSNAGGMVGATSDARTSPTQSHISTNNTHPDSWDVAHALASGYNGITRRIQFQADVQDYVDMSISSTLNCEGWNWEDTSGNRDKVRRVAGILSKYAPRLRGFTMYPDGSRGGQPLEVVSYDEAKSMEGVVFEDNDACRGGVCGV